MTVDLTSLASEAESLSSAPSEEQLGRVQRAGRDLLWVQRRIDELTSDLKTLTDRRNAIQSKELPDIMNEIGLDSFGVNGVEVIKKAWIAAKIIDENQPAAYDWLVENGHGGVIKTEVMASFGRDEYEEALEFATKMQAATNRPVTVDRSIHYQTLQALIREMQRDGEIFPRELLGVTTGTIVEIKKRKEK